MRDELIAAKIVTKIEGSGINGRPAFYTINAEIHDAQEQPVEDSVEVSAAEEVASREHIDTDELLDEHVVRAFTAKAAEAALAEAESVMRSAAPNRNVSVAPWLKRMGPLPRLLRTSLSPSHRSL